MLNLDLAARKRGWLRKSQRQMAEELGVTERTFNRWERGKSTPGLAQLDRWAQALDLSLSELLTDPEPEQAGVGSVGVAGGMAVAGGAAPAGTSPTPTDPSSIPGRRSA